MPYITTEKTGWEYLAYKVAYERAYKMVNELEMEFSLGRSYITAEQAGWEYVAYKIAYSQIQPLKPVIIDTRTALNFLLRTNSETMFDTTTRAIFKCITDSVSLCFLVLLATSFSPRAL